MSHTALRCTDCGAQHVADMATVTCPECGGPLDVEYLGDSSAATMAGSDAVPSPLHDPGSAVTLGEGNTPVIELSRIAKVLGLRRLHAKLEFMSPTGSFKDRGSAVMVSAAREHGVTELVEDSSGNAGASVAAYSASAGIKAHIFAPASAPEGKLRQIAVYGAEVHAIEGPREAAAKAAVNFSIERDIVYASHALSPYFAEGTKHFAYEVLQQLEDEPPDHIVLPVGNGSLLIGAWKGFEELRRAGRATSAPRIHAVQASAVRPVVAAFNGEPWDAATATSTAAGGIAVAVPPRILQMVAALRASGGSAVAVGESDIARWHRLLAEEEGVFAEPTSAAAFAGIEQLVRDGGIGKGDSVLLPVTGSGLKDVASIS